MRFFNKIKLQTPESVELEFTLAGIGNRAYALIIDYLIWGFTLGLSIILAIFLTAQIINNVDRIGSSNQDTLLKWLWAIEIFTAFAIYVGYFIFFETIWQGQTPGKKWVKIRVIQDNGKPARLPQATLRALFRPVDDFLFIGAFFIAFNKREKRLGDLVAGTIIIQDEQAIQTYDFAISEEAKNLVLQLKIEADLSRIKPENFAIIRNYLQRRTIMIPQAKYELSRKLALQVKDILDLKDIPAEVTANQFLEAVYLAYQQQFSSN
jgi:uncharacterized RDD family membrane protein YckC